MAEAREKNAIVAITARTREEGMTLHSAAQSCGFDDTQVFSSPRETLEVAKRKQFQLFITQHDFSEMTGLTMMQTLRSTGNYGLEPHLFLLDRLTPEIMLVLAENNIEHVLTPPYSPKRVERKLTHLWQTETELSPAEEKFREAHAAMSAGLMEMAHELAITCLRTHGPTEKLLLLFGDIQLKLDRPGEARRCYDAAYRFNPKSSAAAHKLAQTYMLEKAHGRAAELMNELTRLNPLNLELLANAGLCNYEVRNLSEAKAAMGQLQQLDKERKDASEILAKVAMQEGDYEMALRQLQATHSAKDLVQVLNNEGIRLTREGHHAGAIDLFSNSLRLLENHPYAYALSFNLGLAYLKVHDWANARVWLQKATELKPDFEKAISLLARMDKKAKP